MTKKTYTLLALGTGAIVGALVAQFVTEKVMESKFDKRLEEERKHIKDALNAKYGIAANEETLARESEGEALEPSDYSPGETKFSKASIDYHQVDTHKTNYSTHRLGDNEEYTFTERKYTDPIYVVSFEEGCEADPGWDMVPLKYYCDDGVLTDENDIPVDETIVGDGLDHFGEDPNDPNTVYVKNHNLKKVYEITALDASYQEDVIGVEMTYGDKKSNKKGREE